MPSLDPSAAMRQHPSAGETLQHADSSSSAKNESNSEFLRRVVSAAAPAEEAATAAGAVPRQQGGQGGGKGKAPLQDRAKGAGGGTKGFAKGKSGAKVAGAKGAAAKGAGAGGAAQPPLAALKFAVPNGIPEQKRCAGGYSLAPGVCPSSGGTPAASVGTTLAPTTSGTLGTRTSL